MVDELIAPSVEHSNISARLKNIMVDGLIAPD